MKNNTLKIAAGLISMLAAGCSPKYYIPNTQNVPVITAKGQTALSVSGNGNQFEVQGAYGITQNIAVQANGGIFAPKDDNNGNGGSGKFIEGGLGYYKNLSPEFLFDTYALFGFGSVENHFPTPPNTNTSTTGKLSADLVRFGIQPGISYHKKYFSVSGTARIVNLNYSNVDGALIFGGVGQIMYLKGNNSAFLIEPALTFKAGLEKFKFQLQFMKSFNTTNSHFKQDNALLSLGFNFKF